MEFIILGRIPGTNIELNFTEVLLGAAFLALVTWSVRHFTAKNRDGKSNNLFLDHAL